MPQSHDFPAPASMKGETASMQFRSKFSKLISIHIRILMLKKAMKFLWHIVFGILFCLMVYTGSLMDKKHQEILEKYYPPKQAKWQDWTKQESQNSGKNPGMGASQSQDRSESSPAKHNMELPQEWQDFLFYLGVI